MSAFVTPRYSHAVTATGRHDAGCMDCQWVVQDLDEADATIAAYEHNRDVHDGAPIEPTSTVRDWMLKGARRDLRRATRFEWAGVGLCLVWLILAGLTAEWWLLVIDAVGFVVALRSYRRAVLAADTARFAIGALGGG